MFESLLRYIPTMWSATTYFSVPRFLLCEVWVIGTFLSDSYKREFIEGTQNSVCQIVSLQQKFIAVTTPTCTVPRAVTRTTTPTVTTAPAAAATAAAASMLGLVDLQTISKYFRKLSLNSLWTHWCSTAPSPHHITNWQRTGHANQSPSPAHWPHSPFPHPALRRLIGRKTEEVSSAGWGVKGSAFLRTAPCRFRVSPRPLLLSPFIQMRALPKHRVLLTDEPTVVRTGEACPFPQEKSQRKEKEDFFFFFGGGCTVAK